MQGKVDYYEKFKEGIAFWKSAFELGKALYSGDITAGDLALLLEDKGLYKKKGVKTYLPLFFKTIK